MLEKGSSAWLDILSFALLSLQFNLASFCSMAYFNIYSVHDEVFIIASRTFFVTKTKPVWMFLENTSLILEIYSVTCSREFACVPKR